MKVSKLLLLLTFGVFASCNFNSEQKEEVDEVEVEDQVTVEHEINNLNLMEDWDKYWNQNDAQGLKGLIADDAVLLVGGRSVTGDSIHSWIDENAAIMRGLTREATLNSSGEQIRYQAGTFSHGVNTDETTQENGSYTIIWEQQGGDDQWKIRLMDISSAGNPN